MKDIVDDKDFIIEDLERELSLKNDSLLSIIDYNHTLRNHNEIMVGQLEDLEEELFTRTQRGFILEQRQKVLRKFLNKRCGMKLEDIDEFITELRFEAVKEKRDKNGKSK